MQGKMLGVIGGMGPMATSVFLAKLVKNTAAEKDQDHIDTIILNHATIPDRTNAIITNTGQNFLKVIRKDIKLLEDIGVENIAIPCNTSHFYYKEMQDMTSVHIINMVEKTTEYIHQLYGDYSKIAILATDGTIRSRIYCNSGQQFNLEAYHPEPAIQRNIMQVIYNYKAGVADEKEFEEIVKHMIYRENCRCVILGCTELSCLPISEEIKNYCIDPMDILVEESIILSGKQTIHSLVMN
ncbi:aspartate/glutamate racemase family protein [Oceanobacillus piezotolerans]|uniref:Aspartate/glutamate racemase family protein n=1 Tax=Oceanobacillus piezotolerans TaxID=2448030 RepID=A0A498DC51_9BACI|nr:amino acid racemase [Oceanobacillus piezotolerans]RLL47812.1 aspartate/glutamate racemase family protein [Oceanobacillus piezotolerans]